MYAHLLTISPPSPSAPPINRYAGPLMGRRVSRLIATGDFCTAILTRGQRVVGAMAFAGRSPALEGWRIGRTKVFLKWWHADVLAYLVDKVNAAWAKRAET